MRFNNLIWDFDGMLFNTYPRMASAFQQALEALGVSTEYDDVMTRIKRSVGAAASAYAGTYGLDRQRLIDEYHRIEHDMAPDSMCPYEGMADLIRDLHAEGRRHFLYTHRDVGALDALKRHALLECFTGFVTADDPFPPKPAPNALLHILSTFQLEPAQSLMLGDRSIDVDAAHNAGIAGCLFDPEHFYDDYQTTLRVHSVDGLRALIKTL